MFLSVSDHMSVINIRAASVCPAPTAFSCAMTSSVSLH